MSTLREIGEQAAIAALTSGLRAVGDDCAVVPLDAQHDLVLTSDPLIRGIHFLPDTPPEQAGWKAGARVLSDFAAMGAEPLYLLVNLVAPPDEELERLQQMYAGLRALLARFGGELVGGDLAQGPELELHVFGAGRVPKGTALLRSGARPGDALYVTGPLGNSFASGRHLTFEPRLREGRWLRECGLVQAMLDVSDGLATDLRHMLKASGTGVALDGAALPCNGTLEQALFEGEDFELLFAVRAGEEARFDRLCREAFWRSFFRIGTMTERTEVLELDGTPVARKAFEHFRR